MKFDTKTLLHAEYVTVTTGIAKTTHVEFNNCEDLKLQNYKVVSKKVYITSANKEIDEVKNINYDPSSGTLTFDIVTSIRYSKFVVLAGVVITTNTFLYTRKYNTTVTIPAGKTSISTSGSSDELIMPLTVNKVLSEEIRSTAEWEEAIKTRTIRRYSTTTGKVEYNVTMWSSSLESRTIPLEITVSVLVDTTTVYTHKVSNSYKKDIMTDSLTVDRQRDYDIFGYNSRCSAAWKYCVGPKKLSGLLYAPNKPWHIVDTFSNGYWGENYSGQIQICGMKEWGVPRPFTTVIEDDTADVHLVNGSAARIIGTYQYRFGTETVDTNIVSTVKIWYDNTADKLYVIQEDFDLEEGEVIKTQNQVFDKNSTIFSDLGYTPRVLTAIICGGGGYGGSKLSDTSSNRCGGGGGGAVGLVAINLENTSSSNPIVVKLGNYGRRTTALKISAGASWISDQLNVQARTYENSWYFNGGEGCDDTSRYTDSLGGTYIISTEYTSTKLHLISAQKGGNGRSFTKYGMGEEATARTTVAGEIFTNLTATIPERQPRDTSGSAGGDGGPSLGSGGLPGEHSSSNGEDGFLGGGGGGGGRSGYPGEGGRGALVLLY